MLLTLLCVSLSTIYTQKGVKHLKLLATLHLLLELSYMLNFIVLTFYWSLIHLVVINKF